SPHLTPLGPRGPRTSGPDRPRGSSTGSSTARARAPDRSERPRSALLRRSASAAPDPSERRHPGQRTATLRALRRRPGHRNGDQAFVALPSGDTPGRGSVLVLTPGELGHLPGEPDAGDDEGEPEHPPRIDGRAEEGEARGDTQHERPPAVGGEHAHLTGVVL